MVRLMLTLTPIVCVASAIAISNILDTYLNEKTTVVESVDEEFDVKDSKSKKKIEKEEVTATGIKIPGLKYPIVASLLILLSIFAFHCTYVTSSAYSSPSVVLASQNRDGSQHIIVRTPLLTLG
jgi:dolichyl-diphosphooligosaccharide--protein glycosyltransferase